MNAHHPARLRQRARAVFRGSITTAASRHEHGAILYPRSGGPWPLFTASVVDQTVYQHVASPLRRRGPCCPAPAGSVQVSAPIATLLTPDNLRNQLRVSESTALVLSVLGAPRLFGLHVTVHLPFPSLANGTRKWTFKELVLQHLWHFLYKQLCYCVIVALCDDCTYGCVYTTNFIGMFSSRSLWLQAAPYCNKHVH